MSFISTKKNSFTLIELLIAMAIIAVTSATVLSIISPAEQLAKTRDSARISQIGQLALSMETYHINHISDTNPYVSEGNSWISSLATSGELSSAMQAVSYANPAFACPASLRESGICYDASGALGNQAPYVIYARLESKYALLQCAAFPGTVPWEVFFSAEGRLRLACLASAPQPNPNPSPTPITSTPTPAPSPIGGLAYYVATTGSDANPGTITFPWKTISFALSHLAAGNTLNLRGGTYYESNLTTPILGTAANPITIQSYPGEQAIIDGGVPFYQTLNNNEWTVYNASINEYQSTRTFTGNYVRAWLTDNNMQIYRYTNQTDMESTNYGPVNLFNPVYFGPGIQLRADGHIYIRLAPNPNDSFDVNNSPITPTPSDYDPNHNKLAISPATTITTSVIFSNLLQYVSFQNLTFAHSKTLFDLQIGSQNVTFNNSTFLYGSQGINYRTNVTNTEIANSTFDNQLPYFVYWTDVKNNATETAEGYPDFQSMAIDKFAANTNIHDNVFKNGFDGILASDGTNINIKNNQFLEFHDDTINLTRGSCGEVAHNILWHIDSGIAILGTNGTQCDMFIHHNIIDNTALRHGGRVGNYRASVWPVWNTDTPFAKHGAGNKDAWWKVYNNTIISRAVPYGTPMNPFSLNENGTTYVVNPNYYIVNNIFYALDNRLIFRDHLVANGGTYDGNVVWQSTSGSNIFSAFGNGGNFTSLAQFQATGSPWEVHGLQIDPGFNVNSIANPSYDYNTIFNRYIPTNSQVFTTGAAYSGLNWPETAGINYRGALPSTSQGSSTSQSIFSAIINVFH